MSRQQELIAELAAANERIARLRGELDGGHRASRTIAVELAARAAEVGAAAGRREAASERARTDANALRRLVAEHVTAVRAGMDPQISATSLIDQLMVRGVSLTEELARAEADRAHRDAVAAAAPVPAPPAAVQPPLETAAPAAPVSR